MIAIAGIKVFFTIIDKVISGHGFEQFKTFEGFEFNYIGALGVITLMALVLLIAPLFYWFDPMIREEQDFKKKYDVKDE
ncbi:hypothetical protein ACFQ2T_06525 [Methylophilus flavus]|uniref:Uncharacterized protein n=1 Tax=Methylophilus flavus TaxID=640084 RepID=A0ABW3PEE7_9PROT